MKRAPGALIAYIGGIRSGKSGLAQVRFAAETAHRNLKSPAYLGTLAPSAGRGDPELAARLAAHRASRPASWATVDVEADLVAAAERCAVAGHDAWFLDGLGAWAALRLGAATEAVAALEEFLVMARGVPLALLVLDEAGLGGVSGEASTRAFADLNGTLNQAVSAAADEVWTVQAGLALRLK
jgi:adenosyl cobinamide kinase/adenosyl cobinamide phosphate guanylyltransferase